MSQFRVGDSIIYHKPKSSVSPGPRARQVYALEHGEHYHYVVDKFWKVTAVNGDGTIEVITVRGKRIACRSTTPISAKPSPCSSFFTGSAFPTDQKKRLLS